MSELVIKKIQARNKLMASTNKYKNTNSYKNAQSTHHRVPSPENKPYNKGTYSARNTKVSPSYSYYSYDDDDDYYERDHYERQYDNDDHDRGGDAHSLTQNNSAFTGDEPEVKHGDDDDIEQENSKDYRKGGYHPVHEDDVYKSRYRIVRKLGWGHFSTVWFAHDAQTNTYVAIKFVKSECHYTEAALDEIRFLHKIRDSNTHSNFGQRLVTLLDSFECHGPNGTHVCMVFEVLGVNLLKLIKEYHYKGFPLSLVKLVSKEVLQGLDYLHRTCGIIHTDLKPENVLLCINPEIMDILSCTDQQKTSKGFLQDKSSIKSMSALKNDSESALDENFHNIHLQSPKTDIFRIPDSILYTFYNCKLDSSKYDLHVKIGDLGNGCWIDRHFSKDIQTRQYRSPEVILGCSYNESADIWSCACLIFELITGDFLFHPKKSSKFQKSHDHIAQIIELLGSLPKYLMRGKSAHKIFNKKGEIKGIKELHFWDLQSVFQEKYGFDSKDSREMSEFLLPMLELDMKKRPSAQQCLRSEWLKNT